MEKILELKTIEPTSLLGVGDVHLKLIEESLPATLLVRGEIIKISGEKIIVEQVHEVLHEMMTTLGSKGSLSSRDVKKLIALVQSANGYKKTTSIPLDRIIYYGQKGAIVPKTAGQERYADLMLKNDIVFSVGPAGTGKTFLAIAFAVAALEIHEAVRIVLCRPAVEAGEKLGFLPGDLNQKVDPYLRPLYDALYDMLGFKETSQLIERNIIEVVPLAFMRGRTINNSFIILDESQNATVEQMKMFLTRFGFGSKVVVTGDITQIDLPKNTLSGLVHSLEVLKNINDVGVVEFESQDVVRHGLVQKIVEAYENYNN